MNVVSRTVAFRELQSLHIVEGMSLRNIAARERRLRKATKLHFVLYGKVGAGF